MNKTKQGYVTPLSDLLVVRFEENIMSYKANSDNHTEYLGFEEDGGDLI